MLTRSGSAKWEGDLKGGKGTVSTQSGVLSDQPYGFNTRFQDEPGTNPEELIGAAHAACFSMALANMLGEAGITGVSIDTTSKITMDTDSLTITKAHLVTSITADADKDQIEKLAQDAKAGCPISKLLTADVTMEASIS